MTGKRPRVKHAETVRQVWLVEQVWRKAEVIDAKVWFEEIVARYQCVG